MLNIGLHLGSYLHISGMSYTQNATWEAAKPESMLNVETIPFSRIHGLHLRKIPGFFCVDLILKYFRASMKGAQLSTIASTLPKRFYWLYRLSAFPDC